MYVRMCTNSKIKKEISVKNLSIHAPQETSCLCLDLNQGPLIYITHMIANH